MVIRLERGTEGSSGRILVFALEPKPIRSKYFQGIAEPHLALSTVFYNLIPLGNGLHLTKDLRTQELLLVLHDLDWSQGAHTLLVSSAHAIP